jgi:hypothetical protein
MSLEYIADADRMTVTLDSGYTAASGSMSLTAGHGARLPSSGDFWIVTSSGTYRAFKVTARSTDTLTVTAAQDDTADGNLDAGTELKWSLTYSALQQLRADLVLTDTYANLPAAATAGRLFLPSDGIYSLRDSGAAWAPWGPAFPLTAPPAVSGLTWVNQGTATAVETYGGTYMEVPANTANQRMLVDSVTAPYVITVGLLVNQPIPVNQQVGLVFRQSSDGKLVTFGQSTSLVINKWTNPTTWSANYIVLARTGYAGGTVLWLRVEDNSTNRICYISSDGQNWLQVHSIGRTDFLTADQVGWGVYNENTTYKAGATLIHWEES